MHAHHAPKDESRQRVLSVGIGDLEIETFTVGGHGGQHWDKARTGVRLRHVASGAVGEARDSRSQLANKQAALHRLADSRAFRAWVAVEHARLVRDHDAERAAVDRRVAEEMRPGSLRVEVYRGGAWLQEGAR